MRIAREQRSSAPESLVADALHLPHPRRRFDFAISIAVIHHFSSPQRRVAAIESILAVLKGRGAGAGAGGEAGRALIYVWALEQKNSRRGWDRGHAQDVFVPWVLSKQYSNNNNNSNTTSTSTSTSASSTTTNKIPAKSTTTNSSSSSSNANADEEKSTPQVACQAPRDQRAPVKGSDVAQLQANTEASKELVYQRYYHLYRQGELEADVGAAGGRVVESGYERDNWWAVCSPRE